ncbi:hypothetical protein BDZ97DRAFT_1757613 [Flammula alnicola]|nr:hypothetical protein BDZ97DRAFT_1757613 [Flammula alnicola]
MTKRVRGSAIEAETIQDLKEKVQSQAAIIEDLEKKLKSQYADWRDLRALYEARGERLNNECLALKNLCDQYEDKAAIASSQHRIEVKNLQKHLEAVNESKLQDLESLKGVKKCNKRLLQEKQDLSNAAGEYMDTIAKWKTKAQIIQVSPYTRGLEEENESYQQALKQAQEEKRDLTLKYEAAEVNFSSQLDLDDLDEYQSKRRYR